MRLLILLTACLPALCQFQGIVIDADTMQPIEGAFVRLHTKDIFTTTDAQGFFILDDDSGVAGEFLTAAAPLYFNGFVTLDGTTSGLQITLRPVDGTPSDIVDPIDPETCQSCHPDIYDQWRGSPMANTGVNTWVFDVYDGTGTPGGQGGFVYQRDSIHFPENFNSDCSACHSPVQWLKTFEIDPPVKTMGALDNINADMHNGVQCEVCHRAYSVDMTLTYNPGVQRESVNLLLQPGSGVQFGLLGDAIAEWPGQMEPAFNPQLSADLCSVCHEDTVDVDDDGDFSPEDGSLDHETTYSEWRAWRELDPENNTDTCISCHMPATDDTRFCIFQNLDRTPGTIRSHEIRGTSPEFLENALEMFVDTSRDFEALHVDVTLDNQQTGHAVPTGVVIRNVILLVLAKDGMGNTITLLEGDLIDEIGGIGNPNEGDYAGLPGMAFYRNYRSAAGDEGIFYTDAEIIVSDNRIQPGQNYQGRFSFQLPDLDLDNLDLEVKLLYRRSFRELTKAKAWTETGHGEPLADVAAPHYGHLMEYHQESFNPCADQDLDQSGSVDILDIQALAELWLQGAPFLAEEEPITNIKHLITAVNCR